MKKVLLLFSMIVLTFLFFPSSMINAKEKEISIIIDGAAQQFDTSPVNMNGSVLVPMRAIIEKFKAEVKWNKEKRQITATQESKVVVLTIDSTTATINGEGFTLPVAPRNINGKTMVPLRFIGEALGADVKWDSVTHSVIISSSHDNNADETESTQGTLSDEEMIKAVIQAHHDYYNSRDAKGFVSTLGGPDVTIEGAEEIFKITNNVYYDIESISEINVTGNEATASFIRIITSIENKNTPQENVIEKHKTDFSILLNKEDNEWKITGFRMMNLEKIPNDYEIPGQK